MFQNGILNLNKNFWNRSNYDSLGTLDAMNKALRVLKSHCLKINLQNNFKSVDKLQFNFSILLKPHNVLYRD